MTNTITVTSASTLMTDYLGGSPITHDGPLAATADADGNNLVFGVGSDGHVRCVQPEPGSATGWQAIDLSAGLPAGATPTQLGATRNNDGTVTLAVVAKGGDGEDHVYETSDFAANTTNRWTDRGAQAGVELVAVTVGYDTAGKSLIVTTAKQGPKVTNYVINPDPSDTSWGWKEVPCPFDSTAVLATAVGHIPALENDPSRESAAVYSLHTMSGGETAMVVTSIPDFQFFNHQVMLTGPTGFDVSPGADGKPVLVAAVPSGSGSQLVALDQASQLQKDPAKVVSTPVGSAVTSPIDRVITTAGSGKIDVWAHGADNSIVHASNAGGQWGEPLGFADRVSAEASWTDPTTGRVDLFFVDLDNQLTWYRQDPTTTRWKSHPIRLSDLDTCSEVQAYRTRIALTDTSGGPVAGAATTVAVNEDAVLTINGSVYEVLKASPVQVSSDHAGVITVVDHVTGVSAPAFTVSGDGFTTHIDPMADLKQQISGLSADDIQNARMATDSYDVTEPMLPDAAPGDVSSAHQAVQSLVSASASLPSAGGAAVAIPTQASTAPSAWALRSAPAGLAFAADPAAEGVGDEIIHVFGDLWHAVKHGFVTVEHLVVNAVTDGVQLIVHAAGKVFSVVAHYVEQVWDVIETVFKEIGAALADLVRWIGFIFRWKDILHTHTLIAASVKLGLGEVQAQLANGKTLVAQAAQQLTDRVVGKDLEAKIAALGPTGLAEKSDGASNPAIDKPESQWGVHHFASHRTLQQSDGTGSTPDPGDGSPITTLITNELGTAEDTVDKVGKTIFDNPEKLTVGQTAEEVLGILEEGLITGVENVALGMIDEATTAFGEMETALTERWNLPVITAVYEHVIAPGSTLSLLDLTSLVVAIPATIGYKVTIGDVPVSADLASAVAAATTWDEMLTALGAASAGASVAEPKVLAAVGHGTTTVLPQTDPPPPPPPPRAALDASYAFGYIGGVGSMVYGVFNGLMVAADEEHIPIIDRIGYAAKGVSGLVASVSSLVSASIALHYEPNHTDLIRYEMFVTCYQFTFNAKDCISWWYASDDGVVDMQMVLDLVETVLGLLNCCFFIALAIAEGVAGKMGDTSIVLKTVQNIVTSLLQIAAFPADFAKDPVTKGLIAAGMVLFGLAPGILNCVRSDIDWKSNTVHLNV